MSEGEGQHSNLRWSRIENLVNGEAVRLVALIPVFGYLIFFNDQIIGSATYLEIAGANDHVENPFFLDGLVKLRMAFFGGIFVFVGNTLFRVFSPEVLRSSKDDVAFADRVEASLSFNEITQIENAVLSETFKMRTSLVDPRYIKQLQNKEYIKKISNYRTKREVPSGAKEHLRAISREYWLEQDHSKPWVRTFSFAFTICGLILLALPTLDMTQAVLVDMFG